MLNEEISDVVESVSVVNGHHDAASHHSTRIHAAGVHASSRTDQLIVLR